MVQWRLYLTGILTWLSTWWMITQPGSKDRCPRPLINVSIYILSSLSIFVMLSTKNSFFISLRCPVWCSEWWLLPHRLLQRLLEPAERLLPHKWDSKEAAPAPDLLPALSVALAALCSSECPLALELPERGHVRAVWWRPGLCQGLTWYLWFLSLSLLTGDFF